jgi:periplasmic protein TonB
MLHPTQDQLNLRVSKFFTKLMLPLGNAYFLQSGQNSRFVGNPYGFKNTRSKTSWYAFTVVSLAHLGLVVVVRSHPLPEIPEIPPKPMMVSMVSEQTAANPAPSLSSPPKQVHQKPVKPRSKIVTNPKITAFKPVKSPKPLEKPVVERDRSLSLASEKKSTPPTKAVAIADSAARAQSQSKPESAAIKYQAPSFNAGYLHNPPPSYPSASRRMGEQGRVLLNVAVSADGSALTVALNASSGSNRLDEAAMAAVRKWRFVPARRGGQAVNASVVVPIKFSLQG